MEDLRTLSRTSVIDDLDHLMGLLACVKRMGWNRAFEDGVLYGQAKPDSSYPYAEPLHSHREALQDSKICMEILSKVRNQLGKKIRTLKRRCAPLVLEDGIRRLPDELLAHIFEIGHLSTRTCAYSLRASHVSSRFRQVAIRSRLLWTRLSAGYTNDQLQTFLSRAGNLPLDVILVKHPCDGCTFPSLVGPLSSRWASLTVTGFQHETMTSASETPTYPNLKYVSHYSAHDLGKWNTPLLSHYVGRGSTMPNNQQLSQITHLELHFHATYLDIRSLAFYQAKNLQNLSLSLTRCFSDHRSPLEIKDIPPPHSFNSKKLKLIIVEGKLQQLIQPLNRALLYLSPSEVDISLDKTTIGCLYTDSGEIFPCGSTIRLRISGSCDLLGILEGLVRRCDIVRSVHFDAPMGYVSAKKAETSNRGDFSSLRHLRLQNCDRLCGEDVKAMARNLFSDDADVGLQSLEIISCKNISEDYLLNLSDDVGERLKWSFDPIL
ncbi:hypothetical protein BD410DRAFT_840646 [Rickenella mellea]|uniref:F-box domain-containing protein n=1 Tax=Rickenella mellea TaxID=50990 RepID=A0A4Y7Q1G2_9AGAM|nr:hypothetical protein BD410DRAFT_840646 [Rickenella mellea]